MTPLVSVVVLNRDRIGFVKRTIKALTFQTFREFELVVVTNQPEVLRGTLPELERAKIVSHVEPNIAAARNAGISHCGGELIAFCDDDAVPEPRWLERLITPFEASDVGATGGVVRGRNGVSVQWGPQEVDAFGNDWPVACDAPFIDQPSRPDRVLKVEGTNCCFRAEPLRAAGGFDLAYRFFLDETDVIWRMSQAGWKTVLVQNAEVHHGFAASDYRSSQRVPRSLFEIGASKAHFCKKFGDPEQVPEEMEGFRHAQWRRLIRTMELGLLEPGRVDPLMLTLEEGFVDGARRPTHLKHLVTNTNWFKPFCVGARAKDRLLKTGWRKRAQVHKEARRLVNENVPVTVFDFSISARMMTVRFSEEGYWLHKGGQFGRSERVGRLIRARSMHTRFDVEEARIRPQRKF